MNFIIFLLVLIVPGLIAALVYNFVARDNKSEIVAGLIFDLLIFIIMMIGLFIFRDLRTISTLALYFDYVSFMVKYALLSILIGIILGFIFGLIGRFLNWWPCFRRR